MIRRTLSAGLLLLMLFIVGNMFYDAAFGDSPIRRGIEKAERLYPGVFD